VSTIVSSKLDTVAWPGTRVAESLGYLAHALVGHSQQTVEAISPPSAASRQPEVMQAWLASMATRLSLEAVSVQSTYRGVRELLESCAPAILRLPSRGETGRGETYGETYGETHEETHEETRFFVLVTSGRRRLTLLGPDGGRYSVATEALVRQLRAPLEESASVAGPIEEIVTQTGLRGKRRLVARRALLDELHGERTVCDCWIIRPAAKAPLRTLARETRLTPLLSWMALLHLGQYTIWIAAWWLLGWMSVRGRFEPALFYAWMLLLLATIPFRLLSEAVGGTLAIRAGMLLKRRLLAGACALEKGSDPDYRNGPQGASHNPGLTPFSTPASWGIGQLLGRVIESEAVESLSVSGGFLALTAIVELVVTVFVLAAGAGSWLHVLLLLLALGLTAALGIQLYRRQLDWTSQRLELTNDLVEQMIGHRTRLAQQPPDQWNQGEDEALERYLGVSRQVDQRAAFLSAIVPRGWLVVGLLGLMPAFVTGSNSTVTLAVALGGVVLAYRALAHLIEGGRRLSSAVIAWQRIRFLVEACQRHEPVGRPQANLITRADHRPVVTARDVAFRYVGRSQPVLQGVDLSVSAGERLLLQGSSGGGKSTLASLLAGSRVADSGLLLLHGLDRETLGAANWRRRVVLSPQFHENHVLMGPLSFNLLMGRRWPPSTADLEEAERICRGLGLGPLLDRMPGGMNQMVGETGWQLSHGEKSRIYIARALLQRADLTILDESFGALDPQNLERTLTYVLAETPTLLVIAHP